VLEACRQSVIKRGEVPAGGPTGGGGQGAKKRGRNRRRGSGARPRISTEAPVVDAEDTSAA
jgi:hypothetical protein